MSELYIELQRKLLFERSTKKKQEYSNSIDSLSLSTLLKLYPVNEQFRQEELKTLIKEILQKSPGSQWSLKDISLKDKSLQGLLDNYSVGDIIDSENIKLKKLMKIILVEIYPLFDITENNGRTIIYGLKRKSKKRNKTKKRKRNKTKKTKKRNKTHFK